MEVLFAILHKVSNYLLIPVVWFIAWLILYMTEIHFAWGRFKLGKFFIRGAIFSGLSVFANFILLGWYAADAANPYRSIVLSVAIASCLYIFIPFALKEENRENFFYWLLNRFWFEKIDKNRDKE